MKDDLAVNIKVNPESIGKLEAFHQQTKEFKQQYLGSWGPVETQDGGNKPGKGLWDTFSVLCYRINQPCARCKAEAQPGEWYLSLCDRKDWNIMEKTEEGSKQAFNLGGLRDGEMVDIGERRIKWHLEQAKKEKEAQLELNLGDDEKRIQVET